MRTYLDANVIVSLLTEDSLNQRGIALFVRPTLYPFLSDFAIYEFVSVIARCLRTGHLSKGEATTIFQHLDRWSGQYESAETTSADIRAAEGLIRHLDLPLRTPDALNISLARRAGAALATFDRQMAEAARQLGLEVLD